MKKLLIIFGLFVSINSLKAQNIDTVNYAAYIDIGFRLEINFMSEERVNGLDNHPKYQSGFFSYSYVSPFSLYAPIKFEILKDWWLELRPGFLFHGEQLSSFVFGLNGYYYPFDNKLYAVFGLQNRKHLNPYSFSERDEISYKNYYCMGITAHNDDEWHSSILFGAGYDLGKVVSVDLALDIPFRQEYGWHDVKNNSDLPNGRYPMKLFYAIKFGFNFFIL